MACATNRLLGKHAMELAAHWHTTSYKQAPGLINLFLFCGVAEILFLFEKSLIGLC